MGRPALPEEQRASVKIEFYVTPVFQEELKRLVPEARGLSGFIRSCIERCRDLDAKRAEKAAAKKPTAKRRTINAPPPTVKRPAPDKFGNRARASGQKGRTA